jgi:hypothetical protein
MLIRVMLGYGDRFTLAFFHHEAREAMLLRDAWGLSSDEYIAAQQRAHKQTMSEQQNSQTDLYHPSVVRSYPDQFNKAYDQVRSIWKDGLD